MKLNRNLPTLSSALFEAPAMVTPELQEDVAKMLACKDE